MPYSIEHKQKSRDKIIQSAITLFTQQGFEKTSIDEIMRHAGLTRGAFYAHFSSKSELYQQSIIAGALNSALLQDKPEKLSDQDWLSFLINGYLSEQHINNQYPPCPLAFLATDVSVSEPAVRQTYTHIFKRMNRLITQLSRAFNNCDQEEIYAVLAMMIGTVTISRCIDQKVIRKKILDGSRKICLSILNGELELNRRDS